jgi:N-acyl-D-amino-acid deacylase
LIALLVPYYEMAKSRSVGTISHKVFVPESGFYFMNLRRLLFVFFASLLLNACSNDVQTPVSSTLLTNAMIYDGSGSDAFPGSVRIDLATQRITAVGDVEMISGETVYDVEGLAVAPGFIDSHSHHDMELDRYRHMPGVVSQGVTTVVRGMDGFSVAGIGDGYITTADFNEAFEANPAAVNFASFSPHNSIRAQVMGSDYRRHANDDELDAMAQLLEADMQAGAIGLSTGLEYEPGIYSAREEIVMLARIAAANGGRYVSHMRDEDDRVMDAVDEIIRIGREVQIPVHISHIKLADRALWGTTDAVLQALDRARAEGIELTADIYPYQRWASNLAILFPERDYSKRDDAVFTFAHTASPEDILLLDFPPDPKFNGLTIADIARLTERSHEDTLMELAQAAADHFRETGEDGSSIIAKGMNESDIADFMQWAYTNICSDGWHGGHPRGYGSFPRVLGRYVRELGILSLPQAIHKMTGLTATTLGFQDRGLIRTGHYADIVLFDPETITDHATMDNPTAVSTGIKSVWVNGLLVFDDGEPTHVYAGQVVSRR